MLFIFSLALILFLSLGKHAPASENDQEATATAWIEAFNAGEEAMATFRKEAVAADLPSWQEMYRGLREGWGDLEIHGVIIPQVGTVILAVRSEKEGRMRLCFSFDEDNRIMGMKQESSPSSSLPPLELSGETERSVDEIHRYLQELAASGVLSGSVLLATEGEVWFERAYGLASREFNVPNTTATRFDVGSFNKDYTQLAILQLVEAGRLALSDKVGRHLPGYPNPRVRKEVTVKQLLEHRSGLGDYFTREWLETPMGALREIDDYLPIWGPKPLEYEPGAREQYSNFGYTVLGAIIEKVTGTSYPNYVARKIFAPAGMVDSGFFATDGLTPNVAVGYTRMDREGRPTDTLRKNIYHEPVLGGPWGKSYSTARDLFRFFQALFAGKLIGPELNWMPEGWHGGTALAGGGPGLSAILLIEDGLAVIVLSNLDEPAAEDIGMKLQEALLSR
jgi:CubicO group peptidase (beta-lactamase class C family)